MSIKLTLSSVKQVEREPDTWEPISEDSIEEIWKLGSPPHGLQRKQISPSFSTIPTSSAPPNIDNVNVAEISPLLPSQSLVPTFVPLDLAPLQIVRCFPTGADLQVSYLLIEFAEAIIPIGQDSRTKDVPSITVSPLVSGEWHWTDPRTLRFDGKFAWSTEYSVCLPAGIRSQLGSELKTSLSYSFSTATLTVAKRTRKQLPNNRLEIIVEFTQKIEPTKIFSLFRVNQVSLDEKDALQKTLTYSPSHFRLLTDSELLERNVTEEKRPYTLGIACVEDLPYGVNLSFVLLPGAASLEGPLLSTQQIALEWTTIPTLLEVVSVDEDEVPYDRRWAIRVNKTLWSYKSFSPLFKVEPPLHFIIDHNRGSDVIYFIPLDAQPNQTYVLEFDYSSLVDADPPLPPSSYVKKWTVRTIALPFFSSANQPVDSDNNATAIRCESSVEPFCDLRVKIYRKFHCVVNQIDHVQAEQLQQLIANCSLTDESILSLLGKVTPIRSEIVHLPQVQSDSLTYFHRLEVKKYLQDPSTGIGRLFVTCYPTFSEWAKYYAKSTKEEALEKQWKTQRTHFLISCSDLRVTVIPPSKSGSPDHLVWVTRLSDCKPIAGTQVHSSVSVPGNEGSKSANVELLSVPIQCDAFHPLTFCNLLSDWQCNKCKESVRSVSIPSYHCRTCNFSICVDCYINSIENKVFVTNEDGLVTIPIRQRFGYIIARFGNDQVSVNLPIENHKADYDPYWIAPMEVVAFTDRGLYRPNEEVIVTGYARYLCRNAERAIDLQPVANFQLALMAPFQFDFEFLQSCEVIAKGSAKTSQNGTLEFRFKLPPNVKLNSGSVRLTFGKQSFSSYTFRVEEFRRPEMEVEISCLGTSPLIVSPSSASSSESVGCVDFRIAANYFSGAALSAAKVTWSIFASVSYFTPPGADWGKFSWQTTRDQYASQEAKLTSLTDVDGSHTVHTELLISSHLERNILPVPLSICARCTVEDLNHQAIERYDRGIIAHPSRSYIGIRRRTASAYVFEIVVVDVDGKMVFDRAMDLAVEIFYLGENATEYWYGAEPIAENQQPVFSATVRWNASSSSSSSSSLPIVLFELSAAFLSSAAEGRYRVRVRPASSVFDAVSGHLSFAFVKLQEKIECKEQVDAEKQKLESVASSTIVSQPSLFRESLVKYRTRFPVRLSTSKRDVSVGDTIELQLLANVFSAAECLLLVYVENVVSVKRFSLTSSQALLRIEATQSLVPNFFARVIIVYRSVSNASFPVLESDSLSIRVSPRIHLLQVHVSTNKEIYAPRSDVNLKIDVTDHQKNPLPSYHDCELTAIVVDESLLAIGGKEPPSNLCELFYSQGESSSAIEVSCPRAESLTRFRALAECELSFSGPLFVPLNDFLAWVRKMIPECHVIDFTSSWANGIAMCHLCEAIKPGCFPMPLDNLRGIPALAVQTMAQDVAEKELGIPQIVEPVEFISGVDELSNMTYISCFRDYVENVGKRRAGELAARRFHGALEEATVRSNFSPLAFFASSLRTDPKGHAEIAFRLPDSLTRFRVIVIASTASRFGIQREKCISVCNDSLSIRPIWPRFLNIGDRVAGSVVVSNEQDEASTVRVALRCENAKLPLGRGFQVNVGAKDRSLLKFTIEPIDAGVASFEVLAIDHQQNIDAHRATISVRKPLCVETFSVTGTLRDQGGSSSSSLCVQQLKLPSSLTCSNEIGGLEVHLSSSAISSLYTSIMDLYQYQYSCSEQLASRLLGVFGCVEDLRLLFEENEATAPSTEELTKELTSIISLLKKRQNPNGSFGLWSSSFPSSFLTTHLTHAFLRTNHSLFLTPASKSVLQSMLNSSLSYLRQISKGLAENEVTLSEKSKKYILSYAAYVFAVAKESVPLLDTLLDEFGTCSSLFEIDSIGFLVSAICLASTFEEISEKRFAALEKLLQFVCGRVVESASRAHFACSYGSEGSVLLFHSNTRTDAILLEALLRASKVPNVSSLLALQSLIEKVQRGLAASRTNDKWRNTQENTFAMLAMSLFYQSQETKEADCSAKIWLGKNFIGEAKFKARVQHQLLLPMSSLPLQAKSKTSPLVMQKEGAGTLYYRIAFTYAANSLCQPAVTYGFSVSRKYEAVTDAEADSLITASDGAIHVNAGRKIRVVVTLAIESVRYHIALADNIPSGFEIVSPPSAYWFDHRNARDHCIEVFRSCLAAGVYSLSYECRATSVGRFAAPPAKAEEMYSPEVFGRSESAIVEIV